MSRRSLLALALAAAAIATLVFARLWPTRAHERAGTVLELSELDAPVLSRELRDAPPPGPSSETTPASTHAPRSTREPHGPAVPRGPLQGLLIDSDSRIPLTLERIVLLASPDDTVAETLRSRSDGTFKSTRAFPRGPVRAWVKDPSNGVQLVRHEAEFDPERAGEWIVPVPGFPPTTESEPVPSEDHETVLRGLVLDLDARPVEDAFVKLIPLEGGKLTFGESGASGEFELRKLAPGLHRLVVQARFTSSAPLELALVEGRNDAGAIVLPAASAGDIRGRLVAEDGGVEPAAVLVLRERRNGKELAVPTDWSLPPDEDDGITSFAIESVPPGDYELELVPFDGRAYEPSSLRVSPPADGLEFRARGPEPGGLRLVARDAVSGEVLKPFIAFARLRGQWIGGLYRPEIPHAFDRWVVYAEGYRPARGDSSDGRAVTDDAGVERRQIEIPLRRGYGAVLLFKDAESDRLLVPAVKDGFVGPGLADVQVLADGQPVALSDADGLAVLDLARAPERLEFVRPGWRVAGELIEDRMHVIHMTRE